MQRHITNAWNAADQITLWRALGSKVYDGTANLNQYGTATLGTTNRYTFVENDGAIYNLRNELFSRGFTFNAENEKALLPRELAPYEYSFSGPARFTSDFNSSVVRLEQRVGKSFTLEVSYQSNHSDNATNNYQTNANQVELIGDPNLTVPTAAGDAVANPRAGQLYMETNWRNESVEMTNDVFRVLAAQELDLGRWLGQHRLAGMYEWGRLTREKHDSAEILVDQLGVPIANASTPEGTGNFLWRRNYVTEGDFRTYFMSDYRIPTPTVTIGDRQYNSRFVSFSQGGTDRDTRMMNTHMFAMQNFWFKRRLVTTFGYRKDRAELLAGTTRRITATDAAYLSGEKLLNEWAVIGDPYTSIHRTNQTRTFGAVAHAHKRLSFFYNQSTNVGTPRLDRTVLPGVTPPASRGKGRDFGLMIDLLGDDRYFIRVNRFQADQLGDAALVPVNIASTSNYFTDSIRRMFNHLLDNGLVSRAEYDARVVGFSAFTIDVISKGWEVDFVANPMRNWTLRLGFSYTDRGRSNYFAEREPYLTDTLAFVRSRYKGGLLGNGRTMEEEITALVDQINSTAEGQEGQNQGARPIKGNFTTRYSFVSGWLKGAFVGGSFQYQDRYRMQRDADGKMLLGSDIQQTNLFAGYVFKYSKFFKSQVRLQLNVNNVFNTDLHDPGRYTSNFLSLRRVILMTPRNWRASVTFNF